MNDYDILLYKEYFYIKNLYDLNTTTSNGKREFKYRADAIR